jgi:nicotinamidase-related amidase
MPSLNEDLHGSVPDKSEAALLLIDIINDLEFEGGDRLARHALPMAERIAALKERAKRAGIPVIYVNDNFGRWRSDFQVLIDHCVENDTRGRGMVERLHPEEDDYFVLKPKHSGFFSTTLDTLLEYLQVKTLILTGVAANICVLFTANDAYMRGMRVFVPADCIASNTLEDNAFALRQIEVVMGGRTDPSDRLVFRRRSR